MRPTPIDSKRKHPRMTRCVVLAGLLVLALMAAFAGGGCGTADETMDGTANEGSTGSTIDGSDTTVTIPPADTTATSESSKSSGSSTATASSGGSTKVRVYYSRGGEMCALSRTVPKTNAVGAEAIKALLKGPTAAEKDLNVVSNIPEGTTLRGLTIKDGIATVDLSRQYGSGGGSLSMAMRLAEVVFTLTQFPTIEGVNFKLDGEAIDVFGGEGIILDHPMNRSDYEELSPAILVESPTLLDTIKSPVRVTGTANVFEATFQLNVTDWDGLIVADKVVTATSGSGTRGTFDISAPFEVSRAGSGAVIVFTHSAKDGSQEDVVEIPVHIEK